MNTKVKTIRRTSHLISTDEFPDVAFEVSFEPADLYEETIFFSKLPDNKVLVGYLSHDDCAQDPLESCDGSGNIYSAHRSSRSHAEMQDALGLDSDWEPNLDSIGTPYAISLDVYDHGGQVYSISGTGTQCQWDTARGGAVWVPDECCLAHIMTQPESERKAMAYKCCESALVEFNAWLSGDTYGVCISTCDAITGKELESEECWGFYTAKYALEEVKNTIEYSTKKEST
ncbi:MAG: hypothetical protein CTY35_03490 [Methylotenera sp.]|nr:MAG: hypothetical protein CTY35_03490 [Methylotenera sp.]